MVGDQTIFTQRHDAAKRMILHQTMQDFNPGFFMGLWLVYGDGFQWVVVQGCTQATPQQCSLRLYSKTGRMNERSKLKKHRVSS